MTRPEFDKWVEEHYGELVAVAKRLGGNEDTVQSAVLRVLESESYTRILPPRPGDGPAGAAWTWLVNTIRSVASHARRSTDRARAARAEMRRLSRAGVSHGRKRPAPGAE